MFMSLPAVWMCTDLHPARHKEQDASGERLSARHQLCFTTLFADLRENIENAKGFIVFFPPLTSSGCCSAKNKV